MKPYWELMLIERIYRTTGSSIRETIKKWNNVGVSCCFNEFYLPKNHQNGGFANFAFLNYSHNTQKSTKFCWGNAMNNQKGHDMYSFSAANWPYCSTVALWDSEMLMLCCVSDKTKESDVLAFLATPSQDLHVLIA